MTGSFLTEPPVSAEVQALYDEDLADGGVGLDRGVAEPR
jgi:hypothetical protein